MTTNRPRHIIRTITPIAAALVLVGLATSPASARQDAGPTATRTIADGGCSLQRVQTQFVRCDNLTGNGVPAPAYIPQR